MRVLIVDDEPAARRRLASLIEEIDASGVEIVGEAGNGVAALDLARERHPDVILLDITMPEVDGFDVARHLAEPRPLIIFQTAHHQYAVQAFEHEALDYVVKPVRKERLAQALERARNRLATLPPPGPWEAASLTRLGSVLGYQPGRAARLLVRHRAGHRLIAMDEILCFSAGEGVVCARTPAGSAVTDYTLAELEARTIGSFVRVSRGEVVNLKHVQRISRNGDGSATLTLSDSSNVRASRRRSAEVRRLLQA